MGMRLAVLSDVHGNPIALDAVLRDIDEHGGADGFWVLGDLVAQGFDPAAVLRRLTVLPNARFVRGNTDRYVLTGQGAPGRGPLTIADAQADPDLVPVLITIAQGLAWTHGYLSATGWIDWLAALPFEQRLTLPDGTRLLGVHIAPGKEEGPGIGPSTSDEEIARLVSDCDADLVLVGDTHVPLDRRVGSVRIVNVGSVSNPFPPDLRASYALLEAGVHDYHIAFRRVAYDTEAVIRAVYESHMFPNPEWLIAKFVSRGVAPEAHASESPTHTEPPEGVRQGGSVRG
jgi:predicted phosphodiesterase